MNNKIPKATISLFTAIIVFHAWSLMRYPPPFVDEAVYAARAWSFLKTSRFFGSLDIGVFDSFECYRTFFPCLPVWIQSASLYFVDEPSLLAVRIVSLVFGLLLLLAIYIIASHLGGQRLALISVLLVSLSSSFIYSAHLARHDVFASALGFVAIALYIKNRDKGWWVSFLSGLLVGLAFEIHPHSAIFSPAIIALFFLDLHWAMFKSRNFWSFIAGNLLCFCIYVIFHIMPYPQNYFTLAQKAFTMTHTPPLLSLDSSVILQAIFEMVLSLVSIYLVLIPVVIWAINVLIKRDSAADRVLLTLAATLVVGVILLIRNKIFYYNILFTPAIELIIAMFFVQFVQRPWRGNIKDFAIQVMVWGSLASFIALNIFPLHTNFQIDYQNTQNRITQLLQPKDIIMCSQTYWFDLYEHSYYSWEQLVYYKRLEPKSTIEDAMREFQPDIFIIDGQVNQYIADSDGSSLYSQHLRISKTELYAFLEHQANLVAEFDGMHYGQVRVYRILWKE
jgi:4-amino-4-deoxy-L-arabinose transferase-like glycosyltransferase